jgi:hypothetical protein
MQQRLDSVVQVVGVAAHTVPDSGPELLLDPQTGDLLEWRE